MKKVLVMAIAMLLSFATTSMAQTTKTVNKVKKDSVHTQKMSKDSMMMAKDTSATKNYRFIKATRPRPRKDSM